ncbi:MAG: phosphonate C-P lyase system protein PhnG [Halocynthiibacter sp.]
MKDTFDANMDRKAWMGLLSKTPEGQAGVLLDTVCARPEFAWLRKPEVGSVMVQGRASATGAPFNLGEMTVTRCALRLASGTVGHAYIQGRNKADAETAALIDALMQTDMAGEIHAGVLTPLMGARDEKRATRAAKAAATKVDFFTMVRGDD